MSKPDRLRWADEAPDEPAAQLLARLPSPVLTAQARARARARLLAALAQPPPARSWRWPVAAAGAALLAASVVACVLWPRTRVAAAGGLRALHGSDAELVVLVGPATARQRRGTPELELVAGTLVLRTDERPARVRAREAEVTTPPRSTVELRLESSRLVVAVYAGSAQAAWAAGQPEVEIVAGHARASDGAVAFARERGPLVASWLAGDAAPARMPPGSADEPAESPPAPAPSAANPVLRRRHGPAGSAAYHAKGAPAPSLVAAAMSPAAPSPAAPARSSAAPAGSAILPARSSAAPAPPPGGARPPAATAAPPPDDSIVRESQLLTQAIERVRRAHDAAGALELLDRYQSQFANGALRAEALSVRIDALLLANRRAQALALLDSLDLAGAPRGLELRVVRGELRAGARRCAEAVGDFTAALALDQRRGALVERALFGRGSCRLGGDDRPSGVADLTRYLSLFPNGQFAAAARRALAPQ